MEGVGVVEEKWEEVAADGVQSVNVSTIPENLHAILTNPLLGEKIVSNLNFGDMKSASAASRHFFGMIRGSLRFKEKAVLSVTRKSTESADLLTDMKNVWRGVRIDLALPVEVLEKTLPLFDLVELLSLLLTDGTKIDDAKVKKFVLNVLSSTSNLTYLQIDLRLINRISLSSVFECAVGRMNLKNLKQLDLLEWDDDHSVFKSHTDSPFWEKKDEIRFPPNFLLLAELPMRLEAFRMGRLETVDQTAEGFPSFFISIPAILRNNLDTLKELSIHSYVWEVADLRVVRLPVLTKLAAIINQVPEQESTLIEFLRNHPTLEELEISAKEEFSWNLFEAIRGVSRNLRKLHLTAKYFVGFAGSVDWSFLGLMEHLEDFKIAKPQVFYTDVDAYGTGQHFLSSLPKNQLKNLSFKGISGSGFMGFWISGYGGEREPELAVKTELLGGFRNVRRLSFKCSPNAVDDKLMEFILREFKFLEELEVGNCDSLSDSGIAGNGEEGGVSLQSLQALKSLTIRFCPFVTPNGVLSCVALPNLMAFEYFTKDPVEESFVSKLMEQNPRLEKIGVNWAKAKDTLKVDNGRWTRIYQLFVESIESDSDSDADHESLWDEDDF